MGLAKISKIHMDSQKKQAGQRGGTEVTFPLTGGSQGRVDYTRKRTVGEVELSGRYEEAARRLREASKALNKPIREMTAPYKDWNRAREALEKYGGAGKKRLFSPYGEWYWEWED